MENTFLSQIAAVYYKNHQDDIANYGFVFPNRRAGLFFRKELALQAQHPIFAPDILGINDLLSLFTDLKAADQTTLLFNLYKTYIDIVKTDETFDHFVGFGNMLLNDFNEIDKYLVNAEQLFHNIADLNEISTVFDYLDESQIEIIKRFWGHFLPTTHKDLKEQYLHLWRNMSTLYSTYKKVLRDQGIGYDGMVFRESALKMQLNEPLSINYKRLIFIGFNALNPTEQAVFDYYKRQNIADYYFDYDSEWITSQPQSAGLFVKENKSKYPSLYPLEPTKKNIPEIDVIAVPSQIGQTKQIYQLLNQEIEKHEEISKTAIILPDESMLIPMLHAIPEEIKTINVTMGYPLSMTPMASLMDYIEQLQNNIRTQKGKILFYYKPVIAILNHPYIYQTDEKKIASLLKNFTSNNKFSIPAEDLQINPLLSLLFKPVENVTDAIEYLKEVIKAVHLNLLQKEENPLDNEFFYSYESAFNRLCDNLENYSITIELVTFFKLIKQLTATLNVPFKGEPLMGLQIMGMLETRALDFEQLIIASFNDDVIPQKEHSQSIIPYNMRQVFGLPTYENNDAIYAYNFFRLLARCKKLTLIYDSRSDNSKSEISRFYYQLKYLFKQPIKERAVAFDIVFNNKTPIEIKKTGDILKKLERYVADSNFITLSPSAINSFLNCPLQFYFSKIAGLDDSREIDESWSSSIFGTIYHAVMEAIYSNYIGKEITKELLDNIMKSRVEIDKYITDTINATYLKDKDAGPLTGYNLLIGKIIQKYVMNTLAYDHLRTPFTYIKSEEKMDAEPVFLSDKKHSIKIQGIIDRIDSSNGITHIIDYKTANIKKEYKDESDLFSSKKSRPKEIMQTLLYCKLYENKYPGSITKPGIYCVRDMSTTSSPYIKRDKVDVNCYSDVKTEFENELCLCLDQLFDADIPFTQAEAIENCEYCTFKQICGR